MVLYRKLVDQFHKPQKKSIIFNTNAEIASFLIQAHMSDTSQQQNVSEQFVSVYSRKRVRLAISLFYFGQGVVFASWASRIPDLKSTLQLF